MNTKMRFLLLAAALAGVYGISAGSSGGESRIVEFGEVSPRQVRTTLLASGELTFLRSVELRPQITGVVSDVSVQAGQQVSAGEVLMTFDQSTLSAELRQQSANVAMHEAGVARARATLERARRQLQRSSRIRERGLISRDGHDVVRTAADIAEFDLTIAQQNLELALAQRTRTEENLRKTIIRAPFPGQVIEVAIKAGETAVAGITNIAGSQLLTLADTRDVMADIHIDEMDVGKVRLGQEVEIDVLAFPDTRLSGRLSELSLAAQTRQGNEALKYLARVTIEDAESLLVRKRMTVRASIVVSEGEADLTVPLRALLFEDDARGEDSGYVYRVIDGRARKTRITPGRSDDTWQVVSDGLAQGDQLVVGPYRVLKELRDGDLVMAAPAATAAAAAAP